MNAAFKIRQWAVSGGVVAILLLCNVDSFAQSAPDFALPTIDQQQTLRLADLKGKVVYLDFWASWCPPCAISLPELEQLQQQYGDQGFAVVAINLDASVTDAKRFLQDKAVSYPVLVDADKATPLQYGVQGMPTAFLLDRHGQLRHVHTGFKKGDGDKIAQWIEQLLLEGG